jgi:hypothetical protein
MHVVLHTVWPIMIAALVAGFVGITAGVPQAFAHGHAQTATPARAAARGAAEAPPQALPQASSQATAQAATSARVAARGAADATQQVARQVAPQITPHVGAQARPGATVAAGVSGSVEDRRTAENGDGPITCWWRTSAGSVRIGEPFSVVLTCAVADTDALRVRVEESRLETSAAQLPPFDVIGGRRASDVVSDGRRFLQFEYTLRLIAEQGFGQDVSLPALQVPYRIERRADGSASGTSGASSASGAGRAARAGAADAGSQSGAGTSAAGAAAAGAAGGAGAADAAQGRDLIYALPPLPIRIASVVPDSAADIREAAVPSLAEIEQGAWRATMLRVLAGSLFALGGLTLALAFVRGVRRRRAMTPDTARGLSDRAILQGVRRELTAVQEQARESSWTPDLATRALTAARIAATCAVGRPIAQTPIARELTRPGGALDGQLLVRDAFRPGRFATPALVSGAATAEVLARLSTAGLSQNGDASVHSDLQAALAQFTAACYGRASVVAGTRAPSERPGPTAQGDPQPAGSARASAAEAASAALDAAMEQTLRSVDTLAAERTWIAESRRAWIRAVTGAKERVWGA